MDFPAAPASAGFATGNGIVLACCSGPALACAVRRALERECPTPQECAIAGPALYPMKAPATAPTGPSTTAPDSAPKAALPARSCAFASTEKNVAAIEPQQAVSSSPFPWMHPKAKATEKMRRQEGRTTAAAVPIQGEDFKVAIQKARGRSPGAGFQISCDDGDMPVICPTCQLPPPCSSFAPHKAAS